MEALVERDAELTRVAEVITRACAGEGGTLVIEGPAGIGKSRLLQAAGALAGGQGVTVLNARGGELERDFAFGVVRQLLEEPIVRAPAARRRRVLSGAAELAASALGLTLPATRTSAPLDAAFAVAHGLYWAVANLADSGPVVLLVDDAHWADSPSLRFLGYLSRRLDTLGVVVAVTIRAEEPDTDQALLAEIRNGVNAVHVEPGALTDAGVAALASATLGVDIAPAFAAACRDATGGNPFLLEELLSALAADGVTPDNAGAARVADLAPRTVASWILARIARLGSQPAVALARGVAVLGHQAELSHAAQLADLTLEEAARAADALSGVGILARGIPLAFSHPIVRTAVYRDLPPGELALAHRSAAELLRAQGASAERLAPHLLAVPPAGDARAVADLSSAASVALSRGAPDLAAWYLARAVAEPPLPQDTGDLLVRLGWAQILSGGEAAEGLRNTRAGLQRTESPVARAPLAVQLGRAVCIVDGPAAAVAVLDEQQSSLRAQGADEDLLLGLEVEAASTGLLDERTAADGAARLQGFADLAGTTPSQRLGLVALALHGAFTGTRRSDDVADIARRGVAEGAFLDDNGSTAPPVYMALYALIVSDATGLAHEFADQVVAVAREEGSAMGTRAAMTLRGLLELLTGRVAEAEADGRLGLAAEGVDEAMAMMTRWVLAGALAQRGELGEARMLLEETCTPMLPNVAHFNPAFWVRAEMRLDAGDAAGALADIEEMLDRNARLGVAVPFVPYWPVAAQALLRLDRRGEAEALADAAVTSARAWGSASHVGVALRCAGEVHGDAALLAEAVSVLSLSPARLEHARALVAYGSALRRSKLRAEAREPLREGFELARRCGATVLAEYAYEELRVAGARPRRLQFSGVDALTAAERRVATMAADGMSNREIAQALFVTGRTIEAHLGHVYKKLGITSRTELASALRAPAR